MANTSDPGDRSGTVLYLLLQLRKANRTILRLRRCALAARDGDAEELRAALSALRPKDFAERAARQSRFDGPWGETM